MLLDSSFYTGKDVVKIARSLIGKALFTRLKGKITSGIIVEAEAYSSRERGSHSYLGRMTERNKIMFGEGGHAYVYLCYGIHHLFNVVTNEVGKADAVLIRALEPTVGLEWMKLRMNTDKIYRITSGPGKLAKALGIDRNLNGEKLVPGKVWLEDGMPVPRSQIVASPRIGIDYAGPDARLPWRFTLKGNAWISK